MFPPVFSLDLAHTYRCLRLTHLGGWGRRLGWRPDALQLNRCLQLFWRHLTRLFDLHVDLVVQLEVSQWWFISILAHPWRLRLLAKLLVVLNRDRWATFLENNLVLKLACSFLYFLLKVLSCYLLDLCLLDIEVLQIEFLPGPLIIPLLLLQHCLCLLIEFYSVPVTILPFSIFACLKFLMIFVSDLCHFFLVLIKLGFIRHSS